METVTEMQMSSSSPGRLTLGQRWGLIALSTIALTSTRIDAAPLAFVTNRNSAAVSVIDTATDIVGAPVVVGKSRGQGGIAITPDGTRAYVTTSGDRTVAAIDTADPPSLAATISMNDNNIYGMAISLDGTRAFVVGGLNLFVVDTDPMSPTYNTVLDAVPLPVSCNGGLAVSPDSGRAYVTSFASVLVVDTQTHNVDSIPVSFLPDSIAITGGKAYVTRSGSDDSIEVIDTGINMVVRSIPLPAHSFPTSLAVTPDGSRAYVSLNNADGVAVLNTTTDTIETTIPNVLFAASIAITPDGTGAYVVSFPNALTVIDTDPLSANYNTIIDTVTPCGCGGPRDFPGIAITPF